MLSLPDFELLSAVESAVSTWPGAAAAQALRYRVAESDSDMLPGGDVNRISLRLAACLKGSASASRQSTVATASRCFLGTREHGVSQAPSSRLQIAESVVFRPGAPAFPALGFRRFQVADPRCERRRLRPAPCRDTAALPEEVCGGCQPKDRYERIPAERGGIGASSWRVAGRARHRRRDRKSVV